MFVMLFKFVITLMSSLEFLFFFDSSSYGLDTPCSHLSMFGNTTKAAQPKIIRTTVVDASPTQSMFLITSNAPTTKDTFSNEAIYIQQDIAGFNTNKLLSTRYVGR